MKENRDLCISLVSGGKDSVYATAFMLMQGFDVATVTFFPKNEHSYMLHPINLDATEIQAKLVGINHFSFEISGEKEREVEEMMEILKDLKKRLNFSYICCGAIKSEYQKERIEKIAENLNVCSFTPLWHKNEEKLIREMVENGFEFLVVRTCAESLEEFLGVKITKENINNFIFKLKTIRANLSGEGGEYETLVVNAPIFSSNIKYKIHKVIKDGFMHTAIIKAKA